MAPPMRTRRLSIIIASRVGPAEPSLGRLLSHQLPRQTFQDFDVHVITGDNRQGRAINEGVRRSGGELIAIMDDDIELGDERVLANLIALVDSDRTVGIAGASCPIPPDSTPFQRAALIQIPRRFFPVVSRATDSDMVQHGCLVLARDLFRRIGGEDEDLVRGLDPILRHRVRELGLRVVVAPGTWFYHRPPRTAAALLRMYCRNGRGSGLATRHFPDRVLELGEGMEKGPFPVKRPLPYRVARRFWRSLRALARGEWVRLSADVAYSVGFLSEYLNSGGPPLNPRRTVRLEGRMGDRIHLWRSSPAGDEAAGP